MTRRRNDLEALRTGSSPADLQAAANLFYRIGGEYDGAADGRWRTWRSRECRACTLKTAHIVFNDGGSVIDCIVRNLSSGGALLVLPSASVCPKHLTYLLIAMGLAMLPARCGRDMARWAWRLGKRPIPFRYCKRAPLRVSVSMGRAGRRSYHSAESLKA